MKKYTFAMCLTIIPILLFAQASEGVLRSNGKFYTVVAVIGIIFIGLAIYLFRLDNKLTKLENQIQRHV
jgi:CcmD family protein